MTATLPDVSDDVRAAIYVRKSVDREGRELGIERQLADCRAKCTAIGATIVGEFADNDVSASRNSTKPRPDYERMLTAVANGHVNVIVSYSTSRLTRRSMEFLRLMELAEERGVRIVTVKAGDLDLNSARGRRRAKDDANRDAEYAEELSELVKREREQRRERGLWNGGFRPVGFEKDGVTPRAQEQELIRSAASAVLAGRSLGAIARHWTEQLGGSPHGATRTRSNVVRDVLLNPRIAGRLPDQQPAQWEPVIDEPTWRGVVAVLSDPERRTSFRGASRLLTGIGLCARCGAAVNGNSNRTGAHLPLLSQPAPRPRS